MNMFQLSSSFKWQKYIIHELIMYVLLNNIRIQITKYMFLKIKIKNICL